MAQINIEQLASSLRDVHTEFKNAVFLIAGDVNLPDIDWNDCTVKSYATESSKCLSPLVF